MLNTSMDGINVTYREGGKCITLDPEEYQEIPDDGRWRSPLFMPRWASRITLEIVSVRVQRVQEVTEEDANAEGVLCGFRPPKECRCKHGYLPIFEDVWDSINAKRGFGWGVNPWVWAIEFKRIAP